MNIGVRKHVQKIIAFIMVMVTFLSVLGTGNIITYAYTAQNGMIYSADKSQVETKKTPSPSGAKANGLLYGKPVTVVDEVKGEDGNTWYKLSYVLKAGGKGTGYCPAYNVLLDKDITVFANGEVNANDVKLRDDAGTDRTNILASLNAGHKVELLDTTTVSGSKWYRVRTVVEETTYIGWMFGAYITEKLPEVKVDEDYEDYLVRAGFPESYVHSLAVLHAQHENWVFEPVITGLDWETVISNESKAGRNLVYKTIDDAKKSYASTEYNWYTNEWTIRDTSGWVTAHPDFISYCMDPRNFLNETNIFMFESLSFSSTHNEDGVNAILNGTFMAKEVANGDGTMLNYTSAFMSIGETAGVSPYHLASRVRQEQGVNGKSAMISGTYKGYEGYYNYFNIGAYGTGDAVYTKGLSYAKDKGWNTRYKSLLGGAQFIAKSYIGVGQDTLYTQKFDVISQGGLYTHQYMTNVQAAISESKSVASAYTDKSQAFVFKIPVYTNMPKEAVQFNASGNRNNYLKSLTISDVSLSPSFDGARTSYSVIVENDVSSVKVSAESVVSTASVSGVGTHNLAVGSNTIKVYCKSQSGETREYTVTIVRESGDSQSGGSSDTGVTSSVYSIGTYITGVTPDTSAATFLGNIDCQGKTAKILTADDKENTGVVATGNKLALYENGTLVSTTTIVVRGDISGDGKITIADLVRLNRHTLKVSVLSGVQLAAADVNNNGSVNIQDLVLVNRHILGIATIK